MVRPQLNEPIKEPSRRPSLARAPGLKILIVKNCAQGPMPAHWHRLELPHNRPNEGVVSIVHVSKDDSSKGNGVDVDFPRCHGRHPRQSTQSEQEGLFVPPTDPKNGSVVACVFRESLGAPIRVVMCGTSSQTGHGPKSSLCSCDAFSTNT